MTEDDKDIDNSNVTIIGHICIRDPDSGEVILRKRDIPLEKALEENGSNDH